MSMPRQKSQ